jgi:hypothetical protein
VAGKVGIPLPGIDPLISSLPDYIGGSNAHSIDLRGVGCSIFERIFLPGAAMADATARARQ